MWVEGRGVKIIFLVVDVVRPFTLRAGGRSQTRPNRCCTSYQNLQEMVKVVRPECLFVKIWWSST